MLSDTMKQVNEAEAKAQEIIQEAKDAAAAIVEDARTAAKESRQAAESAAKQEAKAALAAAQQEGEKEKELFASGLLKELEEQAKQTATKTEAAVQVILGSLL